VSGTFVVNTLPTKVLSDVGATQSFINLAIAKQIACYLEDVDVQLCVPIPIRSMYQSELIARNCSIIIQKKMFLGDLILLGI